MSCGYEDEGTVTRAQLDVYDFRCPQCDSISFRFVPVPAGREELFEEMVDAGNELADSVSVSDPRMARWDKAVDEARALLKDGER